MKRYSTRRLGFATTLILVGCTSSGPTLVADTPVPNVTSGTNFSFDLGTVDGAAGRYYFTDRNNKSVDVVDTKTNKLVTQIGGFAGCFTTANTAVPNCVGADNGHSGPDGINLIPGTNFIYVGDVGSVKVVDKTSNTVVTTINVATGGANAQLRADEGCFDADDNIYMISSPEQNPPFSTFISTTTTPPKIIAKITFGDASGLEQCLYDHGTKSFYVNNDGSTPNPHGEVDVIPSSFVAPGNTNFTSQSIIDSGLPLPAPSGSNGFKVFPEGDCDPTGMDFGPGTDLAISCREGTVGSPLNVLIMDRTSGTILATINAGGGDQITYDSVTNRYYVASSRWNATGKVINAMGTCSATNPCTPMLNVIDAGSRKLVNQLATGNNAHSVAISGNDHKAFLPYSSATAPAGCANCAASYPNGGISVFSTQ
jgi:hypothetical protein